MGYSVIMPKQGLLMVEGTIMNWFSKEGDKVEKGKPLFEMETDKLTITIDSPASGTLLKIVKGQNETVPVSELVAVIGEPGEDISEFLKEDNSGKADEVKKNELLEPENAIATASIKEPKQAARKTGEKVFITPRAKMEAKEKGIDYNQINGTGPDGLITEKDILSYAANLPKATPVASKLAEINNIKLSEVDGTGTGGKITKADIEAAVAARAGNAAVNCRTGKVIPFAGMRKAISDKMMQSLHGMAQANHRMKVDMTEVIRFREKLKTDGIKVSFTDILVKIVAKALIDFPAINSELTNEGILIKDYINMGIAVAVDNGLIVPVIKDADLMTLQEINTVSTELIEKAKNGRLGPDDYRGGTFTITNLGMFDIDEFTPVINYPESGILAIGKIDRVPVAEGDNIVIRPIMVLSLTYDHRVIDGAPAAQFLQRVKKIMQNPYLLI